MLQDFVNWWRRLLGGSAAHVPAVVTLSRPAARAVRKVMRSQQLPDTNVLRIGAILREDGTVTYSMGFERGATFRDWVSHFHGVTVVVDQGEAKLIAGTVITFHTGDKEGFLFEHPRTRS